VTVVELLQRTMVMAVVLGSYLVTRPLMDLVLVVELVLGVLVLLLADLYLQNRIVCFSLPMSLVEISMLLWIVF